MRLARAVHWLDATWWNRPAFAGVNATAARRTIRLKAIGFSSAVVLIAAGYLTANRPYTTLGWFTPGPQSSASWSTGQYSTSGNPVAGDGSVFAYTTLSSMDGSDGPSRIYAFNASTGRVEWTFPLTGFSGAPSPVVGDGTVYVVGVHWLYALSAATGRVLWRHGIDSNLGSGPTEIGSTIYFGDNDRIYALDTANGKTRWATKLPRGAGNDPDVGTVGNVIFDWPSNGMMYGFNKLNGHIRWSRNLKSFNSCSGAPVASAVVYCVTSSGMLSAIDGPNGQIVWGSPVRDVNTTPISEGNTVYVGTMAGVIYAMNTRIGKPRWSFTAAKDSVGLAGEIISVAASGATVYAESANNTEYALNAADGSLRWAYYFGDYLGEVYFFYEPQPTAVVDGSVYLGLDNSILMLRGGLNQ